MTTVPRLWPGSTIVCIGAGPSLTRADVDAVRDRARVIVVNTSYRLAMWADVLYACDEQWWRWELSRGIADFAGRKYSIDPHPREARRLPTYRVWRPAGVEVLDNSGALGIETDPTALRTGRNSGYQAMNLAVHLGAARILLLGYDMKPSKDGRQHWHSEYKTYSPYNAFREAFATAVAPMRALGIEVLNCSRETALTCFPRVPLESALEIPCPCP